MLGARLNHGRWIVDCPECNGAELVTPDLRFRCQSGTHLAVEYAVRVPLEAEWIMQLVAHRPVVNQNWQPGETLEDLARDNAAHGVK